MIRDEGWLELAEVLPTPTTDSRKISNYFSSSDTYSDEDSAIHIFYPRNDHGDSDITMTSVVVQASISPVAVVEKEKDNLDNNEADKSKRSADVALLRLHPVLFLFLYHATRAKKAPVDIPPSLDMSVQIKPLPMLEFQSIIAMTEKQQPNKQESGWRCRPVKLHKLSKGSNIFLSCIYAEDDQWLSSKNDDETKKSLQKRQLSVDQIISVSLEGRIIRADTIMLLSTMYGYVVASITNIVENDEELESSKLSDGKQRSNATYRLSDDVLGDYNCHIKVPKLNDGNVRNDLTSKGKTSWEQSAPGYEPLLEQIIELFKFHGDSAAASGVVLTGCAGVGKSRIASCVAYHYVESGNLNKPGYQERSTSRLSSRTQKIYYSSVQDLIFEASIEANLLENILVPKLQGCLLWIIDDLHLLERQDGSGDEAQNNAEIIMVQNSLIEAIDRFHNECRILGIAYSDTNLPSYFTKSGRLEKTLNMLPPTQLQRIQIWKHILSRDTGEQSFLNDPGVNIDNSITTLASSTAGCVPRDLLRIFRDARLKSQARKNRYRDTALKLEWEDLTDAIKSTTPSQLSELDVLKPTIFNEGDTWKQIHLRSWQNFGGYPLLKKSVYRQVVVPWRTFLQSLDESQSDQSVTKKMSWLEPPPGILFHGASGTGKTIAARCLADSLGLPLIQVRTTDLLDKWLGGSESLLRSLFKRAQTVSPCILFLDEIDAIACNREEDDSNDVSSRILSTLLNEMDGVSSAIQKSRVLVIACTNRIHSIDSALLRPGRLQEHFQMENPTACDLEEILQLRLKKIPLAPNLAISDLALKLFNVKATGADVEGLCRDATFIAMRRVEMQKGGDVAVSQEDFQAAIAERFRI